MKEWIRLDLPANLNSAEPWHDNVGQDDVRGNSVRRAAGNEEVECLLAARGQPNVRITLRFEQVF